MDVGARVWVLDPTHEHVWVSARIVGLLRSPHDEQNAFKQQQPQQNGSDIRGVSVCYDSAVVTSTSTANESDDSTTTTTTSASDTNDTWSDELSAVATAAPSPSKCRDIAFVRSTPTSDIENVLLQNAREQQAPSDLVALPHLHEASILHALRLRYERDAIYTRIGDILISINPFKRLPQLYGRAVMSATHALRNDDSAEAQAPHLFGIARAAFNDMTHNKRSQSILISGESGAGKTEATKIMMKYYALTCSASIVADKEDALAPSNTDATNVSIEAQVLQSNPILEAFGNARTTRNDNSSRFGKFIELAFAPSGDTSNNNHVITGARIRTYLLEKIRVIKQATNERNFHIFYELLAAVRASNEASVHLLPAAVASWQLDDPTTFRLLNQSACYTRRDGVNDAVQFDRTCRAMRAIGMADDEVANVLEIVAAMLHMGNVQFTEAQSAQTDNVLEARVVDDAGGDTTTSHFAVAAALLHVTPAQLAAALTTRQLHTATESLVVRLDASQASSTCHALVMECYRLLFEWLVNRINAKIHGASVTLSKAAASCIGLLDIFGFEDMAANSFEQLCINYANEALQHQFNDFVFAAEQQLYATEAIDWTFVDFPNNQACLDLFERKPIGLFSLADQECLFPQGSDRALAAKLYAEFETKKPHAHFVSPARAMRQTHFVVAHYAGHVLYCVDGFIAKNKDAFCESAAQLLAHSTSPLIQSLAAARSNIGTSVSRPAAGTNPSDVDALTATSPTQRAVVRRATSSIAAASVGTQFKQQLSELLDIIRATTPHYVRCIKPNDANVRDAFECARVVEQLRSGGVLEAVRVARAGFPVRMTHDQFLERYQRVLLRERRTSDRVVDVVEAAQTPSLVDRSNDLRLRECLATLAVLLRGTSDALLDGVSLGKTRVFFRRQPYEQLERHRAAAMRASVIVLQTFCRMRQQRKRYVRVQLLAQWLQARMRGQRARKLVCWMRETLRATQLQSHARRWLAQQRYQRLRRAVICCQSHYHRRCAIRTVQTLREAKAATRIAATWRCWFATHAFTRLRGAVLTLQCAARMRVAKQQLALLRLESKNISKLQEDNLQLKGELAQLKQMLEAMRNGNSSSSSGVAKLMALGDDVDTATLEPQDVEPEESNQTEQQRRAPRPTSLVLKPHDSGNPNCADGFVVLRERRVSFPRCVDLVSSPQKPTLASPNSQATQRPPHMSSSTTQRRTSLPDMSNAMATITTAAAAATLISTSPSDVRPPLSPRTLGRRHSLDLWRAQQQLAEQEVQQLRNELKASTLASSSSQLDDAAQERAIRKLVESQIRAKTMRLQLSPSSSPTFTLHQKHQKHQRHSKHPKQHSNSSNSSVWLDDADDEHDGDESSDTVDDGDSFEGSDIAPKRRNGRQRSVTVEDASFTLGGKRLYAAPSSASKANATSRFSWDTTAALSSTKQPQQLSCRGLSTYFDGSSDSGDDLESTLRPLERSASLGYGARLRSSSGASTWRSSISSGVPSSLLPRWTKDAACKECACKFTLLVRRHHCRSCGHSFCFEHSTRKMELSHLGYTERQRVCDTCFERHLNDDMGLLHACSPTSPCSPRRFDLRIDSASAPIAPLSVRDC